MTTENILVVDNNTESIRTILATLEDADITPVVTGSSEEAWNLFQQDTTLSRVIVRAASKGIDGLKLCGQLRGVRDRDALSIVMLLSENQLTLGAEALIAGATDLLVDPFEPRELRMRANIVPRDLQRRVDRPHTLAELCPSIAAEPQVILPEFNASTMSFGYGPQGHRQDQWEQDPNTKKMTLDRVIVCPQCESIPTFRPGCGSCGSAFVDQQVLIHHFACAHVGPEAEFQTKHGLHCPKCRLSDLIAGSDFEQIMGCLTCSDCQAIFTEPRTIGHCLNCQHRFNAEDGRLKDLVGYQIGTSPNAARIQPPNYASDFKRQSASVE